MPDKELYQKFMKQMLAVGLPGTKTQQRNLALLCYGLAISPNCHLETLALGLPIRGKRPSLVRRLRRLLKNSRIDSQKWYQPFVQNLFAQWKGVEVSLVMDRTDITNRLSILTLGVAYRKRCLPLAWDVLRFGGTSAKRQIELIRRVAAHLPSTEQVRIHFYGDSEFRAVPLQQELQRLGWHWQVGLKKDILFKLAENSWQPLETLKVKKGERRYLQAITLTESHAFGPVNLIADWTTNHKHPRYFALDLPSNKQAWRRGRKRFWIEPSFRDWKSCGFDLENTMITDHLRIDLLLLAISISTLWMIHIGDWLTQNGRREWLEPRHKTDYSLFRLGRDHLQRARNVGCYVPFGFAVSHGT